MAPDLYVGIDIEPGEGVDSVLDLCRDETVSILGEERFGTVHCHCVLEHVPDIFGITRNIERVIRTGGRLFVSAPFAWKLHRIPFDMWRFTPQSIDYLFPHVEFRPEHCGISTRHSTSIYPIDEFPELHLGSKLRASGLAVGTFIRVLRKLKLDAGYFSTNRALMVECNLMMIGQKKASPIYTFFQAGHRG